MSLKKNKLNTFLLNPAREILLGFHLSTKVNITAENTGHDGSLSTGHANSTEDMIGRFESMVLMGMDIPMDSIRSRIASAIDIFVHLQRLPDGSRRVVEISEMEGYMEGRIRLNRLYGYNNEKGKLEKKGRLKRTGKLEIRGLKAPGI